MNKDGAMPGVARFRAPLEEPAPTLAELARRARPGWDHDEVARVVRSGGARVDAIPWRRPERAPEPGELVEIAFGARSIPYGIPEAIELARADDWIIVDKPIGMPAVLDRDDPMNPLLFLADSLGLDRDQIEPVYDLPENAGGPWLLATSARAAARLRASIADGSISIVVTAICERLARPRGSLPGPSGALEYGVSRFVGALCEVQLTLPRPRSADAIDPIGRASAALAGAERPALGDVARGGYLPSGSLRARVSSLYGATDEFAYSWPVPHSGLDAERAGRRRRRRAGRVRLAASRAQ